MVYFVMFSDSVTNCNLLKTKLTSIEIATNALRQVMTAECTPSEQPSSSQPSTSSSVVVPSTSSQGQPPKKKKRSCFDLLTQVETAEAEKEKPVENEVDAYLRLPRVSKSSDPLDFWNKNQKTFPELSKLARIYLGFPASSGSVERLFSVAGSIFRARRAGMTIKTLESVLFYREMKSIVDV